MSRFNDAFKAILKDAHLGNWPKRDDHVSDYSPTVDPKTGKTISINRPMPTSTKPATDAKNAWVRFKDPAKYGFQGYDVTYDQPTASAMYVVKDYGDGTVAVADMEAKLVRDRLPKTELTLIDDPHWPQDHDYKPFFSPKSGGTRQ